MVMICGAAPAMDVLRVIRAENTFSRTKLFETVVQRLENVAVPEAFHF